VLKDLADVVRWIRTHQDNLSNSEFGRLFGMAPQTVDLYMRGERKSSLEFVFDVCSHFHVSTDWMLGPSYLLRKNKKRQAP